MKKKKNEEPMKDSGKREERERPKRKNQARSTRKKCFSVQKMVFFFHPKKKEKFHSTRNS